MLNEPEAGESGGQDGGVQGQEAGGGNPGYIQVTPQEKEAIERVRIILGIGYYLFLLYLLL